MREPLEHLVADARHQRQHGEMREQAQEIVADGPHDVEHQEQQDADAEHDQQERRAAAGMQCGELLRVFGGEGQLMLVAVHGLVLRAVVLEGTPHVGHKAAEDHVGDKNHDFEDAAQQRIAQRRHARAFEPAFQSGGDGNEQPHAQDDGQHHRQPHHDLVHALAELGGEPLFKLGRLLLQHAEHLGGFLQCLHAAGQHGRHVHHAAQEGIAHPLVLFAQRHIIAAGDHDAVIGTAYGEGDRVGRFHHHALHDCLTADVHTGA